MIIMVSACLLGENCKYNGGNNLNEKLLDYVAGHTVIPVCPEISGGLPIPRPCCEIVNNVVQDQNGNSFDKEYRKGAELCLAMALASHVDMAILQSRSPSCGINQIYDGSFSRKLISGNGIFAELLIQNGIKVIDVEDL